MHRLAALTLCLALGACQSPNPYRAESAALPPAPAGVATRTVYPAALRDYAGYRDWAWLNDRPPGDGDGLAPGQLQETLSAELDRRGLRPVRPGAMADLRVAAQLALEWRIRTYEDYYGSFGGYYGYGHGHYHDHDHDHYGYGAWGAVPIVRSYEEQVLVVRVELSDGADGQPVWSGSGEARTDDDPGQRADALRQAVRRALKGFPP